MRCLLLPVIIVSCSHRWECDLFMSVNLLRQYIRETLEGFTLEKLSKLSPEKAMSFIAKQGKLVGSGVGRDVYDVGDGIVIKLAQDDDGVKQNKRESSSCNINGPVPNLLLKAKDYSWIAVEKVKTVSQQEVNDWLNDNIGLETSSELVSCIRAGGWRDSNEILAQTHDDLMKGSDWYRSLVTMIDKCDLDLQELRPDNFGVNSKGTLVLLDTGM